MDTVARIRGLFEPSNTSRPPQYAFFSWCHFSKSCVFVFSCSHFLGSTSLSIVFFGQQRDFGIAKSHTELFFYLSDMTCFFFGMMSSMMSNYVPFFFLSRHCRDCFFEAWGLILYPFFLCTAQHQHGRGFFSFLLHSFFGVGLGWASFFGMHQLPPLSRICLFSLTFSRVCSDTCQAHLFSYENIVVCPHTRVSYIIMHYNLKTRA